MGRTLSFQSAVGSLVDTPWSYRNRLINGAMEIDQRHAGSAFSPVQTSDRKYSCDRWCVQNDATGLTVQQASDAPAGFRKSLKVTVTSAIVSGQCFVSQLIEGLNFSDLVWGTADAVPVVLSFWVKSSLTGTFTVGIDDATGSRCYPATYDIAHANTWERKVVRIPPETSGTHWGVSNDIGAGLYFDLGCASTQPANAWGTSDNKRAAGAGRIALTNGATFLLTGVQLEAGLFDSVFERTPRSIDIVRCLRYFEKSYDTDVAVGTAANYAGCWLGCADSNDPMKQVEGRTGITFQVVKRVTPTMTGYSTGSGVKDKFYDETASIDNSQPGFINVGTRGVSSVMNPVSGFTTFNTYSMHWTADAEL